MNRTTSPQITKPEPARTLRSRWGGRLIAVSALVVLGACGGGGGGGGGGIPPTNPPPPASSSTFTSDAAATANSLSFSATASGTQLTLTLRATAVEDLYGMAFDLDFPSQLLTFQSASELTAFRGPFNSTFQVFQQSGKLVVGLDRLSASEGFTGSADLATFLFSTVGSGTGRVDFAAEQGSRTDGSTIGGLDWIGGSVRVN